MPVPSKTEQAANAPDLVADGDTMIHRHPQREEILEAMAVYVLDPPNKRVSLRDFEMLLDKEFKIGLKCDGNYTKKFLQRYVIPAVVVEPKWVKEGVVKAGTDLNIPRRKIGVADRLERRFERSSRSDEASDTDVATLGKAVLSALSEAEDSLERFGMYPQKKTVSQNTDVKVDLKGILDTMMGHNVNPNKKKDYVDVESEVTD